VGGYGKVWGAQELCSFTKNEIQYTSFSKRAYQKYQNKMFYASGMVKQIVILLWMFQN